MQQPSRWSFTKPIACMNAYDVVGPKNRQPSFFRSFANRVDSGVFDTISERVRGAAWGSGS